MGITLCSSLYHVFFLNYCMLCKARIKSSYMILYFLPWFFCKLYNTNSPLYIQCCIQNIQHVWRHVAYKITLPKWTLHTYNICILCVSNVASIKVYFYEDTIFDVVILIQNLIVLKNISITLFDRFVATAWPPFVFIWHLSSCPNRQTDACLYNAVNNISFYAVLCFSSGLLSRWFV